jgi:hypothetical protein
MEDIVGSAVIRAAGLPTQNVVPVQVRVNNANLASTTQFDMFGSYSWLEAEDGDFVTAHYPTDDAGNYYRGTSAAHTATLAYLGPDPASYLSNYSKQTNREANDWTDLINLTKAFDSTQTPNAAFDAAMNQSIDVTEWLRYFAASTLIGNQETALSTGFGDDYSLYRGILDTHFQIVTHDLDTILGSGDTAGNLTESIFRATTLASVSRLLKDQAFAPLYFAQLRDLISTTFASATFNALLDNTLQSYVPQSVIDSMKTFAAGRVANVLTQIPSSLTATSPLALQNGYPHATTATTSLRRGRHLDRLDGELVGRHRRAQSGHQSRVGAVARRQQSRGRPNLYRHLARHGHDDQRLRHAAGRHDHLDAGGRALSRHGHAHGPLDRNAGDSTRHDGLLRRRRRPDRQRHTQRPRDRHAADSLHPHADGGLGVGQNPH